MRLKLISCEVFHREMAAASARSPNQIELEFISGDSCSHGCVELRKKLQVAIDEADRNRFQGFLLGYGLCRSELAGLRATSIPIVVPRIFDCLARLLELPEGGVEPLHFFSSAKASVSHRAQPRVQPLAQERFPGTLNKHRDCGFQQLAARFGDEVARYFYDEFGPDVKARQHNVFMPKPAPGLGARSKGCQTRTESAQWACDTTQRYMSLIQKLVDGYWDYEDFLVVPPGWQIVRAYDGNIAAREIAR